MVKANDTIFQFYLAMMDFLEKYLSEKYADNSSMEDTKHYQTVIIMKIVRMFHSLELLTKNMLDEVSARCVLRGGVEEDPVTAEQYMLCASESYNGIARDIVLNAVFGYEPYLEIIETYND